MKKFLLLTVGAILSLALHAEIVPFDVENGGFEEWTDGSPVAWVSTTAASNATLAQSEDAYSGSYSVSVAHASNNRRLASKEYTLSPGTYYVSMYVKSEDPDALGKVRGGYAIVTDGVVADSSDYIYITSATDVPAEWTIHEFSFTLTEETVVNFVVMNQSGGAGAFLVDDYTVNYDAEGASGSSGHGYEPDDPFTPAEAIALAETMSSSETVSGVYVKGIISRIDEISTSYGNATYFISEDGTTDNQFEIYRGYYLNGEKFTSEDQIALGDEVVVTGDLVNYYGNTPELTSGNYIYSINGSSETEPTPTPTGHGYEPDDPFTTGEAIELAVSMTASQTVSGVYVKGYITQISEVSTSYGNATYYISTGRSVGDEFEIYRGYYLGGEKFTSEDQIALGDEVVVTGDLVNYYGNTPELTSGNYIYSLNGVTADEPEPEPEPTPPGSTDGVTITDTTITLTNEALSVSDEEVAIDFTLQGYENAESVDGVPITLDEYTTITFAKEDGNNAPMYYNTSTAIRMYADNTLTISSTKKLAKVVLNCAEGYTGNDIATASFEDNEIVYCNYYTQNSGGTQVRCQTLVVTYALDGGDETGISEVAVSLDNDGKEYTVSGQQVSKDYKGIVISNGKKVLKK